MPGARGFVPLAVSSGKATYVPVNAKLEQFIATAKVTRTNDVPSNEALVIEHGRQEFACAKRNFSNFWRREPAWLKHD